MEKMVYQWKGKTRFHSSQGNAQEIGEHLELLRIANGGKLSNALVLTSASIDESPLRPFFEWNDVTAAHRYRLRQAHDLVTSVEVVVVRDDGTESSPVRAFVNVSSSEQDGEYESIVVVANDPEKRKQMLQQALEELNRWRQRYSELQEFVKLFTYVDALMMKVGEEAQRASA